MGDVLDSVAKYAHYAADAVAVATGNGEFVPVIEGVNSAAQNYASGGHNIGSALEHGALSAAGSYAGGQIGGALFGGAAAGASPAGSSISGAGSIGDLASDSLSTETGSGLTGEFAQGLGFSPTLAPSSLGSTLGSGAGQAASSGGSSSILGSLNLPNLGTVGSNLNSIGGNSIATALGSNLSNVGIGSAAGGSLGSDIAQGLAGLPHTPDPTPWAPTQAAASSVPGSLSSSLSGLSPNQQASNLATQGTFGGGLAPEEESYYTNLLNRQLVDQSGNVSPISSLSPIENTYNQQLGFGGNTNSNDLLKALQSWSPS